MAYQIKNQGNRSEVVDEAGRVLFIGSDTACMNYCEEHEVVMQDDTGKPITRATLSKFFDMVQPPDNWKGPICEIFLDINDHQKFMISTAIEFYTGSKAKWKIKDNVSVVTALGYYLTCGA